MRALLVLLLVPLVSGRADIPRIAPIPWGVRGHEMGARAAAEALPQAVPTFFREAGEQLAYLNAEPDRWRDRAAPAMDQAFSYDHFLWMENLPEGALEAPDRFTFMDRLREAETPRGVRNVGLLPYRVLELYERLVIGWRLWRLENDPDRREWVEARILNDAGVLGHYVMDASNPHHASKHHNRWHPDEPNPQGYTTDPGFHSDFERDFVESHVGPADVRGRVTIAASDVAGDAWRAILDELQDSHDHVEDLFRLQRDVGFEVDGPTVPETRDFAAERIAVGARALRDLWWSAWLESGTP